MYNWIHCAVQQKVTKHYKSTIFQLKKKRKKSFIPFHLLHILQTS